MNIEDLRLPCEHGYRDQHVYERRGFQWECPGGRVPTQAEVNALAKPDLIGLVTQGEFDDYQIVYVFQNEEAAARHVKWWNTYWDADRWETSMTRRVEAHEVLTEVPKMDRSTLSRTLIG